MHNLFTDSQNHITQCINVQYSVELKRIVNLLSGYPDPNSSRIVTSSVSKLAHLDVL